MLRRASRRRAELALVVVALVALVLGSGAGAAVRAVTADDAPPVVGERVELGPVALVLPAALGPWDVVSEAEAADLRPGTGALVVDGVWGALAPGSVVVTVLRVAEGDHGGLGQVEGSVPRDEPAVWAGGREHAAGATQADGERELVLVVETGDGDLVILSVCGPVAAFGSGELAEAFRTARVA